MRLTTNHDVSSNRDVSTNPDGSSNRHLTSSAAPRIPGCVGSSVRAGHLELGFGGRERLAGVGLIRVVVGSEVRRGRRVLARRNSLRRLRAGRQREPAGRTAAPDRTADRRRSPWAAPPARHQMSGVRGAWSAPSVAPDERRRGAWSAPCGTPPCPGVLHALLACCSSLVGVSRKSNSVPS